MKKIVLVAIAAILMTSCSSVTYYQVYKTKAENVTENVYEDANCRITYNLWSEGGNAGFTFYNKSNDVIKLNLDQSFFVLNGLAQDYYKARTFTHSSSSSASTVVTRNWLRQNAVASSSGTSTSYSEQPEISIPPKSSKFISEYRINDLYWSSCELVKFPSKRQIKTLNFSKDSSPIVFQNTIVYTLGSKPNTVNNNFYVSEIMNIPGTEAFRNVKKENCGKKYIERESRNAAPMSFYHTYGVK